MIIVIMKLYYKMTMTMLTKPIRFRRFLKQHIPPSTRLLVSAEPHKGNMQFSGKVQLLISVLQWLNHNNARYLALEAQLPMYSSGPRFQLINCNPGTCYKGTWAAREHRCKDLAYLDVSVSQCPDERTMTLPRIPCPVPGKACWSPPMFPGSHPSQTAYRPWAIVIALACGHQAQRQLTSAGGQNSLAHAQSV